MKKFHAWVQAHHHLLVLAALIAALGAAALSAVVVARGTATRTTVRSAVVPVAPQQAPQAKVVARAAVSAATKAQDLLPCPPPPGEGTLGVCTPKPVIALGASRVAPATVDPPVCTPDVSSWQGSHVDWAAVKRWQLGRGCTPAGIFKIGEYVTDPTAATNNAGLKANGMVRQGYWFVRRTGCTTEAHQIVSEARALGLSVVWLDTEVPEAAGYANCLTPTVKAAGITVGTYASPGAFPGGSPPNPAWIAAYGPATPPAAPWGGPIKAFQCSDGVFGCRTYVPGIGYGDVSVDYGASKLGVPVKPPVPLCSRSMCYKRFADETFKARSGICSHGCREATLVGDWQRAKRESIPAQHSYRLWLRYRIQWLAHRLEAVIKRSSVKSNEANFRYGRHGVLERIGFKALYRTSWNGYLKARG